MRPHRPSPRGQASTEYAALLTLVAVVVVAGVALTSGGLGDQVAYALQRGMCAVTGRACAAGRSAGGPDLPPCPLHRASRSQTASGSAGFGTADVGLGLQLERRSDGTATVSFTDSAETGLTAGVGAHFSVGRAGGSARADIAVTEGFTRGRAWIFPSAAAAQRFVDRFGDHQDLLGRAGDELLDACFLCHWLGWRRDRPPAPDAEFLEGGGRLAAAAEAGLGRAHAEARAALEGAIGRRSTRAGEVTYYLRLRGEAAGSLDGGAGVGGGAHAAGVVAYTLGPDGRPRRLQVSSVRGWEGGGAGQGRGPTTERPARGPQALGGYVGAGAGSVLESEAMLDLDDPANARAARALVDALGARRPTAVPAAVSALRERFARHGKTTLRRFRLRASHAGISAGLALGAKVEAGVLHEARGLDLVGVATRLPGLPFRARADCLVV